MSYDWLNSSYWPTLNLHTIFARIPPIGYTGARLYEPAHWLYGIARENSIRRGRIKYCSNHCLIWHTYEVGRKNEFAEI